MALEVIDLHKNFAGVQAVQGISFTVQPGECVALIGPNGAGKSTTFACIAGQLQPSSGQLRWCGQDVTGLAPAARLQRGIARTFQVAQVFDALSVWQNLALLLVLPAGLSPWRVLESNTMRQRDSALQRRVLALLEQVQLAPLAAVNAGQLAYGDRKRLELAMALAGVAVAGPAWSSASQPVPARLLLLDEPAAGLAATERQALMVLIRSLLRPARDAGGAVSGVASLAVLYTEHNMDAVFGVADRVLVLMEGRIVAEGSAQAVAGNAMVQQRYLGLSPLSPMSPMSHGAQQEVGHA